MMHLISFQILIKHQCYFQLFLTTSHFLKEFMLICANINLFGFSILILCKSLKLCIKELGLSEFSLSSVPGEDVSLF